VMELNVQGLFRDLLTKVDCSNIEGKKIEGGWGDIKVNQSGNNNKNSERDCQIIVWTRKFFATDVVGKKKWEEKGRGNRGRGQGQTKKL